jgi:hypothetical protein
MREQVAWNKSSLIKKNILQKTQTLQPFTINIKIESILKSYWSTRLVAEEPGGSLRGGGKAQALKVRVAEVA